MAVANTARLLAQLLFEDKLTPGLAKAQRSLRGFEGRIKRSHAISTAFGVGLERAVTSAARAASNALQDTVQAAIDWESAVAGVNKTIDATPEELAAITQGLRDIAKTTPLAVEDLARIAESAGALGIAKGDVLEFTRVVSLIGTTTDVTTDAAATALGQLANVLGLTRDDFDNFAAALVDLGNKGASTESQILEIARRAGSAATLFGLAKDETLGWASAAANLGMNEELAGTSLQNLLLKAMPVLRGASEEVQDLMGMTAENIRRFFEKDAGGAIETLIAKIGALPKDSRLEVVAEIFGKGSGLTRLVLGLADSYDRNLAPALDTASDAWKANSAALTEAEKRYATTQSQLQILRNNVHDAAITIGSALLPAIVDIAKEMTAWLQGNQPLIKEFAAGLAGGFRSVVDIAKRIPWGAIGTSLQLAGTGARMVLDAFLAMPDWVKVAVVSGWGLNKLSGGALKGVLGSALGGIFSRGGSPANPMWTKEVGLPGGGPGGVGGKGGIGFGAAVLAGGAVIVTALAAEWEGVILPELRKDAARNIDATENLLRSGSMAELERSLQGLREMPDKLNPLQKVLYDLNAAGVKVHTESLINALRGEIERRQAEVNAAQAPQLAKLTASGLGGSAIWQVPGAAGVISRAVEDGLTPSLSAVNSTLKRNEARTREAAEASKRLAAAQAIAERARALQQSFTNMQLAAIARKDFAPKLAVTVPVTVNSTVSVRNQRVATNVNARWNSGSRIYEP